MTITLKSAILATAVAVCATPTLAATAFNVRLDSDQEVAPAGTQNSDAQAFGTLRLYARGGQAVLDWSLTFEDTLDFNPVLKGAIPDVGDRVQLSEVDGIADGEIDGIDNANVAQSDAPQGDDVTRLHIHDGDRGENGPVVFGIINPSVDPADQFVENSLPGTLVEGEWDDPSLDAFVADLLALTDGQDSGLYFNLHSANDPAGLIRGQVVAANSVTELAPIPLPAGLPLLAAALGGLGLATRRCRRGRAEGVA